MIKEDLNDVDLNNYRQSNYSRNLYKIAVDEVSELIECVAERESIVIAYGDSEISRELVFVVDTSGSMGGVSIEQARASMTRALAQLSPADRFNIIAFDSNYRSLFRAPVAATSHHVQQAQLPPNAAPSNGAPQPGVRR